MAYLANIAPRSPIGTSCLPSPKQTALQPLCFCQTSIDELHAVVHRQTASNSHRLLREFGCASVKLWLQLGQILRVKYLMAARDYFALKDRCIYCDVLHQELRERRRLIAENDDFACLALFASGYPFEACVFPKVHSSAFSRINVVQIENLAKILRDILQTLDHALGGPPYNLSLQDRPFLRPRKGYWKTIEENLHWHLEILPQLIGPTGFERTSWFSYNPVPPETAARCLSG